jgi:anaerobic ribonucleoside-triphosphate reductase activating protein
VLIHSKIDSSSVNGPGNRAVLWFQGCNLGCKGCWNPETHEFNLKKETPIEEIYTWIDGLKDIEGITFSGGEPMQQAQHLYFILHYIKTNRPELSIGMFTGYSKKELEEGKFRWHKDSDGDWQQGSLKLWNEIKQFIDFAVTGRYNQLVKTEKLGLRGSRNQEILFLSDRYSEKDIEDQAIEITIDDDLVTITGFPIDVDLDINKTDAPNLETVPSTKVQRDKKEEDEDGLVLA